MRTHTSEFKSSIKEFGRMFTDTIYYTANGSTTTYNEDYINNINYAVDTSLLKSVMQSLTIDMNVDLEVGNTIDYGCSIDGVTGSEIRFNNFTITKKEEQKDTNSYKYTCYDNMIKTMVDYADMGITYPITVRSYISAICTQLGLTFANASDTFTNYDKNITSEHYLDSDGNSLGYTFRDVLDDLAEAVGGFICIDNNGQLEVRYPSEALDGTPKLPSGYTELSYIESDGTQYIDTGMKLTQNHKVELKIKDVPTVGSKIFGSRSSATSNNYSVLTGQVGGNASLVCDFQNYQNNRLSVNVNDIADNEFIIKVNKTKLEINDTSQDISTYTNFTTPGNAYIFNGSGSYPTGYVNASTKLYYCKIWNGNTLVRNFIPCKNSSNVIGLYDLVNNTFYQNAGTGTFTAGDVISYTDTINEEFFQDVNVNIEKKYGPVNVVVLSRNDADNLYYPSTLPANPCEIKINNNPILEQTNREDFIQGIYNALNGLEFYLNDFQTTGIMYLEVGDLYNVSINNTTYPCLMLNDNIIRDNGLQENIYTNEPTTSVTDYKYASTTDKIEKTSRNAYFLADKANGTAEMIVEGIGSNGQVTGASVIASINDDESNLTLNADKINLNGAVTANNNFVINTNGSVSINNGSIDLVDEGEGTTNARINITDYDYEWFCSMLSTGLYCTKTDSEINQYNEAQYFTGATTLIEENTNDNSQRVITIQPYGLSHYDINANNTTTASALFCDGDGSSPESFAIRIQNTNNNTLVDNFWLSNNSTGSNMYLNGNATINNDVVVGSIRTKNLINNLVYDTRTSGVAYSNNGSRSVWVDSQSKAWAWVQFLQKFVPTNTPLTFSCDFNADGNANNKVLIYDANDNTLASSDNTIATSGNISFTFTTTTPIIKIRFSANNSSSAIQNTVSFSKLMIEEGSNATSYGEYQPLNGEQIYSLAETKVGYWINGKPIYRRVVTFNPSTSALQTVVLHNISNVDEIIPTSKCLLYRTNNQFVPFSMAYPSSASEILAWSIGWEVSKTQIYTWIGANMRGQIDTSRGYGAVAILEYTKTTD